MKATRKLVPALAMLVVAAVVMSSASFAWFTMSREVTATGMNVTVTAPNNLLIKGAADAEFTSVGTDETAAKKIKPVSTVDGVSFFAVKDNEKITATTGARDGDVVMQAANTAATDGVEGYYVDFTYTLKTEGASPVNVYVKSLDITRNGDTATDNGLKAVRVAVLENGALSKTFSKVDGTVGTADVNVTNAVLNKNGTYFENDGAEPANPAAVGSLAETTDYPTLSKVLTAAIADNTATVISVPANGTTTLTIRVWVEGEDTNCKVSEAANLDFNVELVLADATYTG